VSSSDRPAQGKDEGAARRDGSPLSGAVRRDLLEDLARDIRAGRCPPDRLFDCFLGGDELHKASALHWTPLAVTLQAARWLRESGVERVVDIGSGAGKFCVAAALATGCTFVGVEQRASLVEAARELAIRFGVADRVEFVHTTLALGAVPAGDTYYLFNPFGENLLRPMHRLGEDVELGEERYRRDVALMEDIFANFAPGTLVIKYNGFGGRMPRTYEQIRVYRSLPSVLRMWRKKGGPNERPLPS
jgi:hypothetical protein